MFFILNVLYYLLIFIGLVFNEKEYVIFLFLITLIYHIFLFFYKIKFFLSFSWIIFFNLSNIVGMFIIDMSNLYLYEINKQSFYTGMTVEIILIDSLFLLGCYISSERYKEKEVNLNKRLNMKNIYLIFFILVLLILILVKINKFAPILGVSRFIYRKLYLNPIEDKIMRNMIYVIPMVSSLFFIKKYKKKSILLIVLFIIYYIAIGHKFGIISYVIYYSSLPIIIFSNKISLKKITKKFYMVVLLLFLTIILGIKTGYKYNLSQMISYFNHRISQQAQLYFSTKINKDSELFHISEFQNELKTIGKLRLSSELREKVGMNKMMKINMKQEDYEKRVKNKSVLAFAFQGLIYYYFNFFILSIIFFFLGLIYSNLIYLLSYSALNFQIFETIFLARLIQNFHGMFIQGELYRIFSLESIFIYLFLILKNIVYKSYKREKDRLCEKK